MNEAAGGELRPERVAASAADLASDSASESGSATDGNGKTGKAANGSTARRTRAAAPNKSTTTKSTSRKAGSAKSASSKPAAAKASSAKTASPPATSAQSSSGKTAAAKSRTRTTQPKAGAAKSGGAKAATARTPDAKSTAAKTSGGAAAKGSGKSTGTARRTGGRAASPAGMSSPEARASEPMPAVAAHEAASAPSAADPASPVSADLPVSAPGAVAPQDGSPAGGRSAEGSPVRQDDPPEPFDGDATIPRDVKIGEYLRSVREDNGITVRTIADSLRIQPAYVEAIEGSRYRELPGVAYATGFVRGYADLFGIDGDEVAIRYKEEAADYAAKASLAFYQPSDETRFPKGRLVALSVVLALGAYLSWLVFSGDKNDPSTVANVPAHLEPLAGQDSPVGNQEAQPVPSESTVGTGSVPPRDGAEPSIAVTSQWETVPRTGASGPADSDGIDAPAPAALDTPPDSPTVAETSQTGGATDPSSGVAADVATATGVAPTAAPSDSPIAAATPSADSSGASTAAVTSGPRTAAFPDGAEISSADRAASEEPASPAAAPSPESAQAATPQQASTPPVSRIILVATGTSWVRVRDANGNTVFAGMMEDGDQYSVPNEAGMTMLTGNAGAVHFLVDDKMVEPVGPLGSVRRGIPLQPDLLLTGRADPGGGTR